MRGTRSRTSALATTVVFMRITPALSTVMTSGLLSLGGGGSLLSSFGGKLSQNVLVTIGVTIMNMISTTSTTSTSGVMLMAGVADDFFLLPPPLPPNETPMVTL